MKDRGKDLRRVWDKIPDETDVLITHGPPYGVMDKTVEGVHAGCEELTKAIERVQPHLHCFSHIHESYGVCDLTAIADMMGPFNESMISVNASIVTLGMQPINQPITINI